jgi:hypothetical protein
VSNLNCSFIKAKGKLMSKVTISMVLNEDPTILATCAGTEVWHVMPLLGFRAKCWHASCTKILHLTDWNLIKATVCADFQTTEISRKHISKSEYSPKSQTIQALLKIPELDWSTVLNETACSVFWNRY